MRILVLNGGSSTFKCWLHDVTDPLPVEAPRPLWEANIEWNAQTPLAQTLLSALAGKQAELVGHRIVHGGKNHRGTTLLTPEVRAAIAQEAEFAPAHNRFELEAIEAIDQLLGGIRQLAVFDTAFHAMLEPPAYVYPVPYGWLAEGVRRYGFHGISYQYATRRAAHLLGVPGDSLRLVLCHLGNGCSLAAVRGGKSVDTTMGFTPLEGLMMGTRSGSLDPGILIYLLRHRGYTADQLDHILNRESGIKGVSGLSGDMRAIESARAVGDQRAQLAFDIFAHRVVREAGGMVAVLGGVDALVFTGGIGENSAPLRERVCGQFGFLGLELDAIKNASARGDQDIAAPGSAVRALVIHAQEEWEIARECYQWQANSG
jgi:acetate kinase